MIFTVVLFARACALEHEKTYLYDGQTVGFYKALMRHFGVNICRNKSYGMKQIQRFWGYCQRYAFTPNACSFTNNFGKGKKD